MRHAITSMFKSVLGVRFMVSGRAPFKSIHALNTSPMMTLSVTSLCQVRGGGGGGEDLPKGGW